MVAEGTDVMMDWRYGKESTQYLQFSQLKDDVIIWNI